MVYQTRSQSVKDARGALLQVLAILIALATVLFRVRSGMAQPPPQPGTVAILQDGWAVNPSTDQVLLNPATELQQGRNSFTPGHLGGRVKLGFLEVSTW